MAAQTGGGDGLVRRLCDRADQQVDDMGATPNPSKAGQDLLTPSAFDAKARQFAEGRIDIGATEKRGRFG